MSEHGKLERLWLRKPRFGWRNDGGPIPYRFRGRVKRRNPRSKTVTIDNPMRKVRVGHWVVCAGGDYFGFSPADINTLYIRKAKP